MSNTFVILGDSPTMLEISSYIPKFLAKYKTISINRIKYKCDYTIGIDQNTWLNIENKIKAGEVPADFSKWVMPGRFNNLEIKPYIYFWHDNDIDANDDNLFYYGENSLTPALNLALAEGAERVIIIACELIPGIGHSCNPNQIFNPGNYAEKAQKIKNIVNEYKQHFELFQIAKPEHLLEVPVVTPEFVLENF